MDKPNSLPQSAHLLDDLESIRQLLGDDNMQPPLLTETVSNNGQIPLLVELAQTPAKVATLPAVEHVPANAVPAPADVTHERNRQDTLLYLDTELRAAAQLIMQDVIADFAPHIETEIKRRLEARLERLLGN